MKLLKISYSENFGTGREWQLDEFELGSINLIVGKNATGKSRTLNVIKGFAGIVLNPRITYLSGKYEVTFKKKDGEQFFYCIEFKNSEILKEQLTINHKVYVSRENEGKGTIRNANDEEVQFKIPLNEPIICRRDEMQYPYLEELFDWASNTRHFRFNKEEGRLTLLINKDFDQKTLDQFEKETDKVVFIFNLGINKYGEKFKKSVIRDFKEIGYNISDIRIDEIVSVKVQSAGGGSIKGLITQEDDLKCVTDQYAMSDGMFRALSVVIHLNYYVFDKLDGLVLIDDIGEGLDFERAGRLIGLLINKSENKNIQLIMSTNDKFVMNKVDLKYWQIAKRDGKIVSYYNEKNSTEVFEEFKYMGLNNFDFFEMDFIDEIKIPKPKDEL